jgi:hypothetical protein
MCHYKRHRKKSGTRLERNVYADDLQGVNIIEVQKTADAH